MRPVIKVEHVSKKYVIDHESGQRYTTLRDQMSGSTKKIFSFFGRNNQIQHTREEFWALHDVNFEVNQGDRVGIIGRNGAGKSTILKILSRIIEPTQGKITLIGRVASLLEVGTGFHPELTGRENIFLNGAILGMSRAEIKKHFDAIVDFAGIEKFLDTPVKRYSSGMHVRLAFAVAAHLEPEILIVDEVLAVGDAEFQKKCLGKMKEVSSDEGRTVIFVSHNMASIKSLCTSGILFQNGRIVNSGDIMTVTSQYLNSDIQPKSIAEIKASQHLFLSGDILFKTIIVKSNYSDTANVIPLESPVCIEFSAEVKSPIKDIFFDIKLVSQDGIELSISQSNWSEHNFISLDSGSHFFTAEIENKFQPGIYYITIGAHLKNGTTIAYLENIISFEVLTISYKKSFDYNQSWKHGYYRPLTKWSHL
mgnify:CR=1 FL=1